MRLVAIARVPFILALGMAIGGCALGGEKADVAATIDQPTAASRAELQEAVDAALGSNVALADDTLTRNSMLTIERDALRDSSGRRIEVREREGPERFRLIKRGSRCVLIHERTQQETILRSTTCSMSTQ